MGAAADLFVIAQGDTAPSIAADLIGSDGQPFNLANGTLYFVYRRADGSRAPVTRTATIVDAATGQGRYDWIAADVAEPGDYKAQFKFVLTAGSVATRFPNDRFLTLRVSPSVG